MNETLLIIDMGTTNIKAVVFDLAGTVAHECSRPTPVAYGPESMEIDPEALWREVKTVCRDVFSAIRVPVAAISMSSMAASFIPLDADGAPLHPAIAWADARSIPYMDSYMRAFLAGDRVPGCGQYPLQMYLPFKIAWFAGARPDLFPRVRKWLNVSEYVYAKMAGLAGEYLTDYSIASRTLLFDIGGKKWNEAALARFGVDQSLLPRPVPAGTVIGPAGRELVDIGCDPATVVVMGGHDHMCFVPGAGITGDDAILNTTGTSEAVVSLLPDRPCDSVAIAAAWLNCEAAIQAGRAAVVGYTGMSGRIFQSLEESVGVHSDGALEMPPEHAPVFLPPQRGQLTSVKGELRGLAPLFDGPALYRAVCDGMYMECRRMLERVALVRGVDAVPSLRMVGGHTKNENEVRRKSAVLGVPIDIVRQPNLSSMGAAMIAGAGCGMFASFEEAVAALFRGDIVRIEPPPALAERLGAIYRERYLPCFEDGAQARRETLY